MQVAVMTAVARDGFWDGGWMRKLPLVSRSIVWPDPMSAGCERAWHPER